MYPLVISTAYYQSTDIADPQHENCHRLLYIADGQARITVGDTVYIAPKNSLVIISQFERYTMQVSEEPFCLYAVGVFPDASVFENYSLLSVLFNRNAYFSHVIPAQQHGAYFCRAFAQLMQCTAEEEQSSLLLQILSTLQTLAPEAFADVSQDGCKTVRQIQNRFERNFQQKISLAQLADEFHLSTYYLSHLFKRITGYSLMGYLRCCRIAAAKRYLIQTEMSIEEIVTKCGFSDSNNFGRTFKSETGFSPSKFRQRYMQ